MNINKSISFLTCLILINCLGYAQYQEIIGTVIDKESDIPLPGVNILLKGTHTGAITDQEGNFSINASPGDTLLFFSMGFLTQEIILRDQDTLFVDLSPNVKTLSEVIVTGYSVDRRRQITGSVATVESQDLTVAPSGNVEQMLQGRVAGLSVITDGQPGTSSQVRIHGYGALRGPLYIVDGVTTETIDFLSPDDIQSVTVLKDASAASIYGARASGGVVVIATKQGARNQGIQVTYSGITGIAIPGNGPSVLNPFQQAEWTWTAIANTFDRLGLPPDFNHSQYGMATSPILPDWLMVGDSSGILGNIDLEAEMMKYNIDSRQGPIYQVVPANREGTDWYKAMTRSALIHRHNLGLSGGGENSRYYIGLNAQEQEGTILHQQMERYSVRFNSAFDILPGLRIGKNIQATSIILKNIRGAFEREGGGNGAVDDENEILAAFTMAPIIPVHDKFGGYAGSKIRQLGGGGFAGGINPVASLTRSRNDRNTTVGIFGNVFLEFEPLKSLVARTSFGGQYKSRHIINYNPRIYEQATEIDVFTFNQIDSRSTQWIWTNTLKYELGLDRGHILDFLLGQEALNIDNFRIISGSGNSPFSETIDFINPGTVENRMVDGNHSNGINFSSYFGQFRYDFRSKYQAALVVRRDGSSRFGSQNRWGMFPAVSVGWRISEEPFMRNSAVINDLRLRAGYGEMGNSNNIPANNQFNLFGTDIGLSSYDIGGTNQSAQAGFYRSRVGNPSGKWETSVTEYIGLDASLWSGKLNMSIDIWREDTEDLLYPNPITVQNGRFNNADNLPWQNLSEMRNQGVDLGISANGYIFRDLSYRIDINGSFLSNKLTSLGPGRMSIPEFSRPYIEGVGITPTLNLVGASIASFYGYEVQGIFSSQAEVDQAAIQEAAAVGRFRFRDLNEDGIINTEDRAVLGDPIADFTGGISAKFAYNNFELQFYGYTSLGNEIFNLTRWHTDFFNLVGSAINPRVLDSWSSENIEGTTPIFEYAPNFSTSGQSNSYYVEDGSYFRLQNITLAYNFPPHILSRLSLKSFRLSASVNNLFTITDYTGLDPNVAGAWDHRFGIDVGNFPVNRSWTLGVQVSF